MSVWRHLRAIGLLPVTVTLMVPGLILWRTGAELAAWPAATGGVALIGIGLALVTWTVSLFARIGKGTLAPWDPTARLVVVGRTAMSETP